MRVLLLSTYELGHQPLHLAEPAGALAKAGHDVRCLDLSVQELDSGLVEWAEAVAISVPMHTATRLAFELTDRIRSARPSVQVALFGLYAAVGATRRAGGPAPIFDFAITGEYVPELVRWVEGLDGRGAERVRQAARAPTPVVKSLRRADAVLPRRDLLPGLERYARLTFRGEALTAGYVEASHGCAHRCRHCPVPVVYDGRTRLVDVETMLADVEHQVALGARHITFGDPDFLNGPHHARRVVSSFHEAFPGLTFDVTVKVEHILRHRDLFPQLADGGCLFCVSAFESTDDDTLRRLRKGHTAADEIEAVAVLRGSGIEPRPSLLPFTPWTRPSHLVDLLDLVARADLTGNIDPVQYSIRLLVPPGSLLLEGDDLEGHLLGYDPRLLGWTWRSKDAALDELQGRLASLAVTADAKAWSASETYRAVRETVANLVLPGGHIGRPPDVDEKLRSPHRPADRPRLSESWFCCAEPNFDQIRSIQGSDGSARRIPASMPAQVGS